MFWKPAPALGPGTPSELYRATWMPALTIVLKSLQLYAVAPSILVVDDEPWSAK